MEITGKVKELCELIQGETAAGPWCKRDVVVTTAGDDATDVAVTFFGERKVDKLRQVKVGDLVQVFGKVRSRNNGERWFTSVEGQSLSLLKKEVQAGEQQEMRMEEEDLSF